jgi:hypothetical protein
VPENSDLLTCRTVADKYPMTDYSRTSKRIAHHIEYLCMVIPAFRQTAQWMAEEINTTRPPDTAPVRWEDIIQQDGEGQKRRTIEIIDEIRKAGIPRFD